MRLIDLASILLLAVTANTAVATTTIYSWTDDNGVIHFSDSPDVPQATTVELSITEVQPSLQSPLIEINQTHNVEHLTIAPEIESPPPPPNISLLTPLQQQTIRSNEGDIKIRAVSNRKLGKNVQAQLVLDGNVKGAPQTRLDWQLTNIDRGTHQIQIQLINNGKILATSESITVYLHRASQARPKNSPVQPR